MYGIALSAAACLRGGTRVDVAWSLDEVPGFDPTDAVAITPGGGRLGSLLGGAIDSRLVELSLMETTEGRFVDVEVNEIEAAALKVEAGTTIRIFFAPGDTMPEELWGILLARDPVTINIALDGARATAVTLGEPPASTSTTIEPDQLTCSWCPTPKVVIYGGGPMAQALAEVASFMEWTVEAAGSTEGAIASATSLSPLDAIVVMGHYTEAVGSVLETAMRSEAGYIGSIGPDQLQQDRGDWLCLLYTSPSPRDRG